ncbi:MAG: T9SS type A sorting domain-containing protein [Bacteroidia bacterium]
MKIKLLFLSIFFGCKVGSGQTVFSSCNAPDSIIKKYKADADRLTIKRINTVHSSYMDSVKIPKMWSDTILKALIAVYNATSLPARNTIVGLDIHTFPDPTLTNIKVSADSNLFWMHQLYNNNIPTGFSSLDSLINLYNLNVDRYNDWSHIMSYHTVTFRSDSNYNISRLVPKFDSLNGVMYTELPSLTGDGNDIKDSILPTYVKLIYIYGWQDCESGCISKHFWEFKVYYDCSVEFTGEYGSPYSTTSVAEKSIIEFRAYPNPFDSKITVTNNSTAYEYTLINSLGHVVRKDKTNDPEIISLENLPSGVYALHINSGDLAQTIKLLKK